MNKTKIIGLTLLLTILLGTISLANSNNELKTIKNEKTVPIENVDNYKNSINNELVSDGVSFTLKNVEEIENKKTLTKDKEISEELIVTTNDKYYILNLFESKKNIKEDGYIGILELQNNSLDVKVNDSYKEQYKVYLQKEYTNVASNELDNIPKQIEKDGITYYLVNPVWNIASTEKIENNDVPTSYNGIMNYEGIKEKTIIKNYKATVKYKGTLEKEIIESITFKTEYEEIPKEETNYIIPVIATTGGIIVFSGIIIFSLKDVKIYNLQNGKYKLVKKVHLDKNKMLIDLTPINWQTKVYKIVLSKSLYKSIEGKNIKFKYFDKLSNYTIVNREFEIKI